MGKGWWLMVCVRCYVDEDEDDDYDDDDSNDDDDV